MYEIVPPRTSSTRSCPKSSFCNAVEFAETRLIRAPNTQCFDVYVELLHKDCIAQRLSPNKQSKVTTGTITFGSVVEKGLRQSRMAVVTSAFSKSSVFAVQTNTHSRRFQIYPLWRAFSKSSVFGQRKRRFSVDGSSIRIKKVAFSNLSGLVWT